MLATEELTELQWKIVHAIAIALVNEQSRLDPNSEGLRSELEKTIVYLRTYQDQQDVGKRYFNYLNTLAKQGHLIGHSKKTRDYYQSISDVCQQYLKGYENNPLVMLQILGWVKRLMRYYQKAVPMEELEQDTITANLSELQSERQLEIAEVVASKKFEVGQIIEAKISNKTDKGKKITYEILERIKLSQKEPKLYGNLTEEQIVKVEIVELKEDGTIKKVKYID